MAAGCRQSAVSMGVRNVASCGYVCVAGSAVCVANVEAVAGQPVSAVNDSLLSVACAEMWLKPVTRQCVAGSMTPAWPMAGLSQLLWLKYKPNVFKWLNAVLCDWSWPVAVALTGVAARSSEKPDCVSVLLTAQWLCDASALKWYSLVREKPLSWKWLLRLARRWQLISAAYGGWRRSQPEMRGSSAINGSAKWQILKIQCSVQL